RDGGLDREAQVPLEDGEADALRDHLHGRVEDRAAEVEALADDVVVGRLDHGDAHALGGGVEGGPDHLDGDGVDGNGAHHAFPTSTTRHPWSSTLRRSPASISVVVPASSTAAGASLLSPARRCSGCTTRYSIQSCVSIDWIFRVVDGNDAPARRSRVDMRGRSSGHTTARRRFKSWTSISGAA